MAIKRTQRQINPSRVIPVLGYISKGVKVANAPIDTNRFWVNFNSKIFSPAELVKVEQYWRDYHELTQYPEPEQWLSVWKSTGGADEKTTGNAKVKMTPADAKRSILTTGMLPNGMAHSYGAKRLDGLTLITDDHLDDISYESWLEWHYRNKQDELKMLIRCDTETQVMRMNRDTWRLERSDIPCQRDTETGCQCKPTIQLRVVYWDFMKRFHLPFGYFVVQSGAWHDDNNILPSLGYIQQTYADAYGIPLSRIPFSIWREPYTYSYDDKGKTKTKTDNVIKLAATTDFILSLESMPHIKRKVSDSEAPNEPAPSVDPQIDEDELAWQSLAAQIDEDEPDIDLDFDPFDNAIAMHDELLSPDADYDGQAIEEAAQASYNLEQWWGLCFGASIEDSLEYWRDSYPSTEFPSYKALHDFNGMFLLAKALADAKIRVPIDALHREANRTFGYLGVDKSLKYHVRTVESLRDAGLPDEQVEQLRKEGTHLFNIAALEYPTGILVMKERQSGRDKGTVYFDMTEIELS